MNQKLHYWLVSKQNGLQFKECIECEHTNTLEYHFDVISGDIVECENCNAKHEII